MKKFLGCLLIIMMVLSACEGPAGPMGPPGKDADAGMLVFECNVLSEHWKPAFDDLMGDFFEYEFRIRELTGYIFDEGAVFCYLVQNIDDGKRVTVVQSPLPYTFYGVFQGVLYSENYTYEIRPGYINFIVKISDFDTQAQQPLDCTFRVVMMWKN